MSAQAQRRTLPVKRIVPFTMMDRWGTTVNVKDRWGRTLGALIQTFEEQDKYGLHTQQTRDGVPYGASQAVRWFLTEPERAVAIEKYIKNAKKRATVKWRAATLGH